MMNFFGHRANLIAQNDDLSAFHPTMNNQSPSTTSAFNKMRSNVCRHLFVPLVDEGAKGTDCSRNATLIDDAGGRSTMKCWVGRNGIAAFKREGDGASPAGVLRPLLVAYRSDRMDLPPTRLPVRVIGMNDGWCDDPQDPLYNRPVTRPYPASHEAMWRGDHAYDLVVITDHNHPPSHGHHESSTMRKHPSGSAIFLHLLNNSKAPYTQGCLAFERCDLLALVSMIDLSTRIWIGSAQRT